MVTPRAALLAALGAGRLSTRRAAIILERRESGSPVFPGDVDQETKLDGPHPCRAAGPHPRGGACEKRRPTWRSSAWGPRRPLPDWHYRRGLGRTSSPCRACSSSWWRQWSPRAASRGSADRRPAMQAGGGLESKVAASLWRSPAARRWARDRRGPEGRGRASGRLSSAVAEERRRGPSPMITS